MKKLLIAAKAALIVSIFLLAGCGATDLQQLRMKDNVEMQKSEWRLPGHIIVANMEMVHRGFNGEIKDIREYRNIVVNTGKACTASRINGDGTEALFNYVAIGTGVTAEGATQTALVTEISTGGGQRAIATLSRVTTTVTNDTARWVITYNFSSSFAVTESGIFNAASSGCMLARKLFSVVNVANGDSLQITWRVQVQ